MKTLFVSALFILIAAALVLGLTGFFSPATLVGFSLAGLGLIYALALWAAFVGTPELQG